MTNWLNPYEAPTAPVISRKPPPAKNVTVKCAECGKPKLLSKFARKSDENHFCDAACKHAFHYRKAKRSKPVEPTIKNPLLGMTRCWWCHTPFKQKVAHHHYCTIKCQTAAGLHNART